MKIYCKTWAAACFAVTTMQVVPLAAQEIERGNPFVAPPAWAEEQARLDERTRIIFRELEPELKNDIMKRVNESQATLEIKLRKRIDLVAATINSATASAPANQQGGTAGQNKQTGEDAKKSSVPEGSTFISCVNKEALYRDPLNILHKVPKDDPQSVARCGK
jgi:hypothetical protein|nr:hypothetical protein [Neorhizobium tomejilense]